MKKEKQLEDSMLRDLLMASPSSLDLESDQPLIFDESFNIISLKELTKKRLEKLEIKLKLYQNMVINTCADFTKVKNEVNQTKQILAKLNGEFKAEDEE